MTYQPVIAGDGVAAWSFLKRTFASQSTAHAGDPLITRDTAYFEARIGEIGSAEELVADRRLLRVALGAFGLGDDVDNRYFIRRILEDGTIEPDALANRLSDQRYREFSKAFGFGDFDTPSTKLSDFGEKIVAKYRRQEFEIAVGSQNDSMRLALNADRAILDLAETSASDQTKWLRVLGTPPLRAVLERALGFPDSFSQLDLDRQLEEMRDRAASRFGVSSFADLARDDTRETLIRTFLLQDQVRNIRQSQSGAVAVSLMQAAADFAHSLKGT